ncbi:MAG: hypothetical protein AAFO91_13320, partial [Bacteroidota bacterium]
MKEKCDLCQAPLNLKETSISRVSCKDATGSTPITNCAVYDQTSLSPLTCKYCKIGFEGDDCDPTLLDFPVNGPAGDLTALSMSPNHVYNSVVPVFRSGIALSRGGGILQSGYFYGIDFSNKVQSIFSPINQNYEVGLINPNGTMSYKYSTTVWANSTSVPECVMAGKTGNFTYCVACPQGKLGKTFTALFNNMTPIAECVDAAPLGIQKKYTGMGYVQDTVVLETQANMEGVGAKMYVAFDSCTGSRTLVVYIYENTGQFTHLLPHNYSNMTTPYQCVDEVLEDNKVENCHVYGYAGSVFASTPDLSTTYESLGACLSCKPGYYGVSAGSGDLEFL